MPVIPGFQGRSRFNMNVPVETATPASTLGDAFANVGGQTTKIGLELMAFRKKAADARDVSEKSLQLQQELLETTTDLDNARMNDGSLNPEVFGFKDKEKQTRYSYTEKLGEFWNERLGAFSKTAASPESREDFLRRARGLREESILKGEAKTLELEVAATLNTFQEGVKAVENQILVLPELDVVDAAKNAAQVWADHDSLFSKGLINEPTYRATDKKVTRGMTIASLDNFVRNKRPDEIEALIFSGNLPKDYVDTLEQAQAIHEAGGLAELRKQWAGLVSPEKLQAMEQDYMRLMKVAPENRLKYRGDVDAERLSQSLSRQDIEKYLREAIKLRQSSALNGATTAIKEQQALNRRLLQDRGSRPITVDEMRVTTDRTAAIVGSTDNFDTQFERAKDTFETLLNKSIGDIARQSLFLTEEEHNAYIEPILKDPTADVAAAANELDNVIQEVADPLAREGYIRQKEILESVAKGEYSQQFSEMREKHVVDISKIRQQNRERLMTDPASLFQNIPVGPERVAEMDRAFNAYNIAPHNKKYVSTAEVQDFKKQFTAANDEGKAMTIAALRDRWGGLDNWFKVMNQYVDESGLPRAMGLAMMMPNTMAMESFISVVTRPQDIETDFKNKNSDLEASVFYEAVNSSEVFEQFNEAIAGMMPSTMEATGPLNDYRKALAQYSMHIYNKSNGAWYGDSSTEVAAKAAYQEIIGSNFVVASNGVSSVVAPIAPVVRAPMRAEGEFYPKQSELESFIDVYSDPKLMASLATGIPDTVKEFAASLSSLPGGGRPLQQVWEDEIQRHGYWATAPDLSGLILRFKDDSPYRGDALTQDGSPVIIPWQRLVNDPRLKAR